ncbi:DsbA family protein [Rhodopseudomonas boonkerdii]|uniref:DsbA family protein n=1 Tax=Rhodopseudomonas boonkerdii TaxID=475937 RepID=UPI001E343706|nr:DsbA family protein [Rhodopseudomonas boonkerdii]UGV25166.1 DsbA family protein [Rhodopseudomonas boonkerdii]
MSGRSLLTLAPTRRTALALVGGAMLLGVDRRAMAAPGTDEDDEILKESLVLRDPDIPASGNPKGDITIVEYFDYQCPYCRKLAPDLRAVVKEDGNVRLVSKDWAILGPVSVYAAGLVLATRYQNRFIEAQDALISLNTKLTEQIARDTLAKTGIDVERALADLQTNRAAIAAKLKQIDKQATAFGFRGTPSFIVGKFRIPGPISKEHFKLAIADARKAVAERK